MIQRSTRTNYSRESVVESIMIRKLKSFIRDEEAATAVEYSVLLALILMAIIGTVTIVGTETNEMLGGINDSLQSTLFGG